MPAAVSGLLITGATPAAATVMTSVALPVPVALVAPSSTEVVPAVVGVPVMTPVAVTMLPFAVRMSGLIYLVAALALGGVFLIYVVELYRNYSDALSRTTFKYSIFYLAALFSALLVDHYWR